MTASERDGRCLLRDIFILCTPVSQKDCTCVRVYDRREKLRRTAYLFACFSYVFRPTDIEYQAPKTFRTIRRVYIILLRRGSGCGSSTRKISKHGAAAPATDGSSSKNGEKKKNPYGENYDGGRRMRVERVRVFPPPLSNYLLASIVKMLACCINPILK